MRLDADQTAIVECYDKVIVANACAGSGKTTMAQFFADARQDKKILYLCFGKANQVIARARFGKHVDCRTGHSLAYEAVGHRFDKQNVYFLPAQDFARQLKIVDARKAAIVLDVLNQFCSSQDAVIGEQHLLEPAIKWGLNENALGELLPLTKLAWTKICVQGSGIGILPDFYLKMWALSRPRLERYNNIILDEAQDTNPVLAQIVEDQTHTHRLLVGDKHQSIYHFRGAMNAMATFEAMGATVMHMPRTWRFGPDIADKANKLLSLFKGEKTAIIGAGPSAPRRAEDKRAVLSRSNAGLIAEAAAVYGRNVHWVGGIKNYKVDVLVDAYHLSIDQRSLIRDSNLRGCQSWSKYKADADRMRDGQAKLLIKLVDQYRKDIPNMVRSFHTNALETEAGAKLVLSTMHKAKGLEYDHVTIGEDFRSLDKAMSSLLALPLESLDSDLEQEINGLYVGFTRARHQLDMNTESKDFFKNYPRHVSAYQEALARANLAQDHDALDPMQCHQANTA